MDLALQNLAKLTVSNNGKDKMQDCVYMYIICVGSGGGGGGGGGGHLCVKYCSICSHVYILHKVHVPCKCTCTIVAYLCCEAVSVYPFVFHFIQACMYQYQFAIGWLKCPMERV